MALAIVFLSFVVVTGLGGMVSLAQGTFVTAGGFAAGWAVNHDFGIDVPFVASHGKINFAAAAVLGCAGRAARSARSSRCRSAGWACSRSRWRRWRSRWRSTSRCSRCRT